MKVLVVDGNNLIFRSQCVASVVGGDSTDGMLGIHLFFSAIKGICERYKPGKIVVCWDKRQDGNENLRKTWNPEYKGNRDADKAVDVHRHNHIVEELLNTLGCVNFFPKVLEADDCMSFIKDSYVDDEIIIASGDEDLLQLVDERTCVWSLTKKLEINHINFDQYAKAPRAVYLKYKSIVGDKSDNVKGVPKFGPVRAMKFLNGELQMTKDEYSIVEKNYNLFRLDMYKEIKEELYHYQSQELVVKTNMDRYEQICREHKLNNMLKAKDRYFSIFVMSSKLLELFA